MKLSQVIAQYVDLKQSMGARFHTESVILKAFCKTVGDIDPLAVEAGQVQAYILGVGPVTRFCHRKLDALRGFYRFALGRGYVTCAPLPDRLPRPTCPFTPYIYSMQELCRLITQLFVSGLMYFEESPLLHK